MTIDYFNKDIPETAKPLQVLLSDLVHALTECT